MSLELRLGVRRFGEGADALTFGQLQVLVAIAAHERVERRPVSASVLARGMRVPLALLRPRLAKLVRQRFVTESTEPRVGFERARIPFRRVWSLTDAGRSVLR